MSSTETSTTEPTTPVEHHKEHPTPRQYVNIALVLAVLTALEVSTYFFDFGVIAIPLLVILMAVKFVYVAGFFMHLKYDVAIYSRMMYTGCSWLSGSTRSRSWSYSSIRRPICSPGCCTRTRTSDQHVGDHRERRRP